MSVTWLDWFTWTRCELQRRAHREKGLRLPEELKTPEGAMRVITWQCASKFLEAQRRGETVREVERLLAILYSYFLPQPLAAGLAAPRNLRLERAAVQPLLALAVTEPAITGWLECCQEIPLLYIDLPRNAWMISETVQVQAVLVDNGIRERDDVVIYFNDEPRSTISVLLAPRSTRCKRRLVWAMGTDDVHDELHGGTTDDLASEVPPTSALIATSGLTVPAFCRMVEQMIAAVLFQEHSLEAAHVPTMWAGRLPADRVRRAAHLREDETGSDSDRPEQLRSLFRIERIGLVPEAARRRLPQAAIVGRGRPLLCPVWVRGHWRKQRHGSGLRQTKRIWIDAHHKGPEEGQFRHSMRRVEYLQKSDA